MPVTRAESPAPLTGSPAPDFELRDQHGQWVSLSSYRGRASVLLVFYPFAFSGVCSGELAGLRDHWADVAPEHAQLLAISCDPVYALRAFAELDKLNFPLLSDFWPHGQASTAYGAFDAERGCSARSSFVIDRDGVLRWQVHNALPDARDLAEYAQVLGAL
ncbi:MAG: Alkyl hydroperoxide reductase subunit C-like protein [uncultured Nocardioidaceae bacterium]|uniref:Alkyl hydroperoxide reductase E n=1 Tax=uncultured Nocardioidaceae bacterium TaxID=253824 RepID=A0A6J4MLZ9_9ACTN|nr:MAG: Alkyl hydroperoxide reductase subunit C-like protein [uncultured Nocardioidaceae bacterium]